MTTITKQATIVQEIRAALAARGPLSTADLVPLCETADDSKVLSRVIYELRNAGQIAVDPVPGPPGRDGRPAKRYRWIGPDDGAAARTTRPKAAAQAKTKTTAPVVESIEDEPPVTTSLTTPLTTHTPMEEIAAAMPTPDKADPTELAIADLVDQADEALLAYADSLLADDPVWKRIRRLADETHGALCDYRLMRSLESNHA